MSKISKSKIKTKTIAIRINTKDYNQVIKNAKKYYSNDSNEDFNLAKYARLVLIGAIENG